MIFPSVVMVIDLASVRSASGAAKDHTLNVILPSKSNSDVLKGV